MNRQLKLIRDISRFLLFASGGASVSLGWWFLLFFVPAMAVCFWWDDKIRTLIETAIREALREYQTEDKAD